MLILDYFRPCCLYNASALTTVVFNGSRMVFLGGAGFLAVRQQGVFFFDRIITHKSLLDPIIS